MCKNRENKSELLQLFFLIKDSRFLFIVTGILSITEVVFVILYTYVIKSLLDNLQAGNYENLVSSIYMGVFIFLLEAVIRSSQKYLTGKFRDISLFQIRKRFVEHILALPIAYMEKQSSGGLQSKYINDVNNLKAFFTTTLFDVIKEPLILVVSLGYMLYLNWQLAMFSLIITPLFIIFSMKMTKPVYDYTRGQQEALSIENSILKNSIGGFVTIKTFLLERVMHGKYSKAVDNAVGEELKLARINSIIQPAVMSMQLIPVLLSFLFGNYLLMNHRITLGELLAIMQLQNTVFSPIMKIPEILSSFNTVKASLDHIMEVFHEPPERSKNNIYKQDPGKAAVSLKNIYFSYLPEKKVIDGISTDIENCDSVALVGKSGCGKSTLLKIIMGVYEPDEGRIEIWGHDVGQWDTKILRDMISIVSQDTVLFPGSIYMNILYGKLNASKEDVMRAAKDANLHDFILSLPDGYETSVGEHGVSLSGGQKQRIAIARAILKDSPIIIMDEPTSSLDAESENLINETVNHLMEKHTVVIIAHRLSTIKNVKKILVIDKGKIAAEGTHDELMRDSDIYRLLYRNQYVPSEIDYLKKNA